MKRRSSALFRYGAVVLVTVALTWSLASVVYGSCKTMDFYNQQPETISLAKFTKATKSHKHDSRRNATDIATDYRGPSRIWNRWHEDFPCFPGEPRLMLTTPAHKGLLFQRPQKVGSTTMAGIVLRLAHNRFASVVSNNSSQEQLQQREDETSTTNTNVKKQRHRGRGRGVSTTTASAWCQHRSMHGSATSLDYGHRHRHQSFLFSLLRHPTQRAISEFFHFAVAVYQVEPTDRNFREHLQRPSLQHVFLEDLATRNYTQQHNWTYSDLQRLFLNQTGFASETQHQQALKMRNAHAKVLKRQRHEHFLFGPQFNVSQIVQDILHDYDFVAVLERFDESLVVLQMLLNLTTQEILYTHARGSGTFVNGPPNQGRPCAFIPKAFVTRGMAAYLASEEWQHMIRGDWLLYQAAWASLDRTIETLGSVEFEQKLSALRAGLKRAEAHCRGRVKGMCTEGGEPIPRLESTCYIWGVGCDHACLDEIEL